MDTNDEMITSQNKHFKEIVKGDTSSVMSVETEMDAGLGLLHTGALNVDMLLSVFQGNHENMAYFIGLWDAMKHFGDEDSRNIACDPRDMGKQNSVANWRPLRRVCSADVESLVLETDLVAPGGTIAAKQVVLDGKEQHQSGTVFESAEKERFHCGVHGCGEVLSSLASYEAHYHHCHSYVCATCRRVFVSDFLLDIHLQENHDSYFAILSPRIDMYRCLVESCELKFRTPELRKDHLVSIHKFPSNFSFHHPVKENKAKNVQNSSKSALNAMETSHPLPSTETRLDNASMDIDSSDVTISTAKKKKKGKGGGHSEQKTRVPSSICFGRGSQKAFQQPRGRGRRGRNWYQTNSAMETDTKVDIEAVDMNDLAKALT